VPLNHAQRAEKIRPLVEAELSTREIARITDIPQSTVVRDIQKINTGPHPIMNGDSQEPPPRKLPRPRVRVRGRTIMIVAAALLILAAGLGSVTLLRAYSDRAPAPPAHVYAPIFPVVPASIELCIGVSIQGYLTDLAPATNGRCPSGWQKLVLKSSG
jgi:hypothetical protein